MTLAEGEVKFEDIVGKGISVEILIGNESRWIHGFVGKFKEITSPEEEVELSPTSYVAWIYPALWFLKFTSDCRIFQDKSVVDIVKMILGEHKILMDVKATTLGQTKRDYCVQYNETHFDFISRLLEEAGIYYYFEHAHGKHVMVLMDDPSSSTAVAM